MDYYNGKDFSTMQEEAVKRVREMQKRSRSIVNGDSNETREKATSPTQPPPAASGSGAKSRPDPIQSLLGGLMGGTSKSGEHGKGELFNIGGIKIDEEKALIGLLIYILYKQGSDIKLLLALGYLLL